MRRLTRYSRCKSQLGLSNCWHSVQATGCGKSCRFRKPRLMAFLPMQRWAASIVGGAVCPDPILFYGPSTFDLGLRNCSSIRLPELWSFRGRRGFIWNMRRCRCSLRRDVECMVWRPGGRLARDCALQSRFLLLLPAPMYSFAAKPEEIPRLVVFYSVSPVCRLAERCAKECHRIAPAGAATT